MEKIVAKTIIEILGSPKEHVEKTLKSVIDKVKEKRTVRKESSFDAKKVEEDSPLWTCFCELEVEFRSMEDLFAFCFDFMPSSIEVLEPSNVDVKSTDINMLINDLMARLHKYDMIVKNLHAQTIHLQKQLDEGKPEEEKPEEQKKE